MMMFIKHLPCVKHHAKYFTCVVLFNLHNSPGRYALLISSLFCFLFVFFDGDTEVYTVRRSWNHESNSGSLIPEPTHLIVTYI